MRRTVGSSIFCNRGLKFQVPKWNLPIWLYVNCFWILDCGAWIWHFEDQSRSWNRHRGPQQARVDCVRLSCIPTSDSKWHQNGLLGILMGTNEWFMRPKKNSCEYYGNKQISNLWEQWWEQMNTNLWEHGWQTCRRKLYLQTCKRNWNLQTCNQNLNLQTAKRIFNLQTTKRILNLQNCKRKGFEVANL
jgi:hypothetical protein